MNATGFFIPPAEIAADYPSHVQWSGANSLFSPPECDAIIAAADAVGWQDAAVGSPGQARIDKSYRCVETTSLPYLDSLAWLYKRVTERVHWANQAHWQLDLTGLLEPFQVLRYTAPRHDGDVPGHYDWHQDFGAGYMSRRKLTVVAQLSDGTDYDGCELTVMSHRQETLPYRDRGSAVTFPCWTPHHVAPIARGTRYALVAWVHGSPLR
jgi:PKHD-type hydroxylase